MIAPAPLIVLLAALSLGACSNRDSFDESPVGETPSADSGVATDDPSPAPGTTADADADAAPFFDVTAQTDPTDDEQTDDARTGVEQAEAERAEAERADAELAEADQADAEQTLTEDPVATDDLPDDANDRTLDTSAPPVLSDGDAILVPAIPGDLNAARVLDGLQLILARTVLDLNDRLSSGIDLTAQQEGCLGTYEPGLGDPLFGVDCSSALVTEPVNVFVERGVFHDTDACRASLAERSADDCVIAFASVFTKTVFEQTFPERRPRPLPGSGVVIGYAVDGPVLEIASDEQALLGVFGCRIDLATGSTLPGGIGNCNAAFGDVAIRLDELLADVR